MKKIIQWVTLGLALSCTMLAQAAKPVFLITPVTKAPSTIYAGQTLTVSYNVTNNTPYALEGNGVVDLPVGVTQAGGNCNTPFNLETGASCTLVLQIIADELNGDVRGGPKVCNTLAHPIYCSRPSAGNELNITKSNTPPPTISFKISGVIAGLTDNGLVLKNNGADDLTVLANATSFVFATPVAYGGGYDVTVAQSPPGLTCTPGNNAGTNVMANITDISIICSPTTFSIGGTITGLDAAGLILRNNNDDTTDYTIESGETSFVFPTRVAEGGSYNVTVVDSPLGLTCTASSNAGAGVDANVNSVIITCSPNTYSIGGDITGLNVAGLILRNNNDVATELPIDSGAPDFKFLTEVAYRSGYNVTVFTQPAGLTCVVSNGTGTVTDDVTDVRVDCAPLAVGDAYGGGVVYRINGSTAYILSLANVSESTWGLESNILTRTDNTFNTSSDNTYTLLAGSDYPAAEACRNYAVGEGVNTWFLPAQDEWPLVVANIDDIYAKSDTTGFIPYTQFQQYWSSTQVIKEFAYTRRFSSDRNTESFWGKLRYGNVRCVRALTI